MTKHIDDFLDIPHESELEEENDKEIVEASPDALPATVDDGAHAKEADVVRKIALDLQDEVAEVARNVEPGRSARMFEVSGQYLKIALEASNSKEKRKMEAAKLKLEAAKLKIEDATLAGLDSGNEIMVDRNILIRQLMAEEEEVVVDVEAAVIDEKDE